MSVHVPAPELKEGEELKGCLHKGKLYELGTSWKGEECMDCYCTLNGLMRCCTEFAKPVKYDPERCVFVFNKEKCKYELIPNEDPEKQCLSYSSVGLEDYQVEDICYQTYKKYVKCVKSSLTKE